MCLVNGVHATRVQINILDREARDLSDSITIAMCLQCFTKLYIHRERPGNPPSDRNFRITRHLHVQVPAEPLFHETRPIAYLGGAVASVRLVRLGNHHIFYLPISSWTFAEPLQVICGGALYK